MPAFFIAWEIPGFQQSYDFKGTGTKRGSPER